MILDAALQFSSAQAITSAVGSSNTVDLGAASRDIGQGEQLFLMVVVTTVFSDTGSNSTLTVALEGDSTESFSPDATVDLFTLPALAAAGNKYIVALAPGSGPLAYRYVRLKYTPNNGDLAGGAVSAYLLKDIEILNKLASGVTVL